MQGPRTSPGVAEALAPVGVGGRRSGVDARNVDVSRDGPRDSANAPVGSDQLAVIGIGPGIPVDNRFRQTFAPALIESVSAETWSR